MLYGGFYGRFCLKKLTATAPGPAWVPVTLPMVEPSTARILEELRDDPRWAPLPGQPWSDQLGPFGHFLLRVPGADHLLDPCGGRRLYPNDCRELLQRQYGPDLKLQADHLRTASPRSILQRLSRNLRQLYLSNDDPLAALVDAERVLELGHASAADYLARASLYQRLDCPSAERFDLEHALLLSEDPIQRLRLTERLGHLPPNSVVH